MFETLRGVHDTDQASELYKEYNILWMKVQGNGERARAI